MIATSEVRIGRELVDTARRNRDAHGGVSPPTLEDLLAVLLETRTDEQVTVELEPGGDAVLALLVATAPLRLHRSSSVPVVLRPTASAEAGGRIVVDVEVDASSRRVGRRLRRRGVPGGALRRGAALGAPTTRHGRATLSGAHGRLADPPAGREHDRAPDRPPQRLAPHRSAPGDTCRARPRPGRVLHEPLSGVRGVHGRLTRPHRPRDGTTRPEERGGTVSVHVGCRRRGAAWVADEALPWTDRGPPFE